MDEIGTIKKSFFSMREVVIIVILLAIGSSILISLVERSREDARRMSCANNLRQLGLALMNYESTYGLLPALAGGTDGPDFETSNQDRLSPNISMLPFLAADPTYNQIMIGLPIVTRGGMKVPGGPAPWTTLDGGYIPWRRQDPTLRCPSDPGTSESKDPNSFGRTNFAFSVGDTCEGANWKWSKDANRGMFQARYNRSLRDATDGLSYTLLMAEIGTDSGPKKVQGWVVNEIAGIDKNPSACLLTAQNGSYLSKHSSKAGNWRGARWPDGSIVIQGFNTILPPNSPSCSPHPFPNDWDWGIYSASSYHPGGVNVLFGDFSVQFVSNNIDSGSMTSRAPGYENRTPKGLSPIKESPFGIWGALGTRAGGEVIPENNTDSFQ